MMDRTSKEELGRQIADMLRGNDVFLRAEDCWVDWEDFKKKTSFENLENFNDETLKKLVDDFNKGMFDETYEVEIIGDRVVKMFAKGINAIKVSPEYFCKAVFSLEMMGYDDDDFMFVLFKGKNLGTNLFGDGNIVIPKKFLALFCPGELFDLCHTKSLRIG